ncbi:hypothetical protein V8C86DRAFT_39732 [Haematococcus lacustris]
MLMAVCHVPLHVASVLLSPSPLATLHVDVAQLAVNTLLAIIVLLLLHTGLNSLLPGGLPQAGGTEGQEGGLHQARGMQGPPAPPSPLLTPPNTPPGTPPSAPVWWLGKGCAAVACMPSAGMAVPAQGVTAPQQVSHSAAHGHTSRSRCQAPESAGQCTNQQLPGAREGSGTSPALQVNPEVWQWLEQHVPGEQRQQDVHLLHMLQHSLQALQQQQQQQQQQGQNSGIVGGSKCVALPEEQLHTSAHGVHFMAHATYMQPTAQPPDQSHPMQWPPSPSVAQLGQHLGHGAQPALHPPGTGTCLPPAAPPYPSQLPQWAACGSTSPTPMWPTTCCCMCLA